MNSGRWVIVTILTMAIAATAFAWWFRGQQGHRALDFWGSEAAYAIRFGPEVTAWQLQREQQPDADEFEIDGETWWAIESELSKAKGLVHARQALIEDASYRWDDSQLDTPNWDYALRFAGEMPPSSNGAARLPVTLLIDSQRELIRRRESDQSILRVTIGKGLEIFLSERFSE